MSNKHKSKFKQEYTFEERKAEGERIREKYPDRIPVIVEKAPNAKDTLPDIDKKKFLVPIDIQNSQLSYVIRKRIKLSSDQAMFLFINGKIPPSSELIGTIYEKEKDLDSFLYYTYMGEDAYGSDRFL